MSAGGGNQPAAGADAVVQPVGDGAGRQPRGEAQLVQPVELANLHRQQTLDIGREGAEVESVGPHPDHFRARIDPVLGLDGRQVLQPRRHVGGAGLDHRAQDRIDAGILAHDEDRLRRVAGVLQHHGHRPSARMGHAPAGAQELVIVEVAQGVGREEAIGLEKGSQQRPIRRLSDGDGTALASGDRPGGHPRQPRRGPGARGPVGPSWCVGKSNSITSAISTGLRPSFGSRQDGLDP